MEEKILKLLQEKETITTKELVGYFFKDRTIIYRWC